jgi:hypothetical protein
MGVDIDRQRALSNTFQVCALLDREATIERTVA